MQVEAYLENKDIGFVKVGQPAQVKIATFDYTKYGTIPGRVVTVSQDALAGSVGQIDNARGAEHEDTLDRHSRYLVHIALDRSTMGVDGREQALSPGMAVTVEVKTGRRRIIEYALSPIFRQGSESFHER